MKRLGLVVISCIFVSFLGVAQQSKPMPLLGSTQDFTKSPFCKKYKCVAEYTGEFKVFSHFVLTLPDDNPNFYEDFGQTTLFLAEDKKHQLVVISLWLQQKKNQVTMQINARPSC